MRKLIFVLGTTALVAAAACGGESREIPVTPTVPSDANAINLSAPTPASPGDDQQLSTLRPTLSVTNATSGGSGSRTYEFQIADNSAFAIQPTTSEIAFSQPGVPEGTDGRTSFALPIDLQATTRYYWRARATEGAVIGPWSATRRFRTRVESVKGTNMVFDLLTNLQSVADQEDGIGYFATNDADPGAKMNSDNSYLAYKLGTTVTEGEASFVVRRIKPTGDRSYVGQTKIFTMLDGTRGPLSSNASRVSIDRNYLTGALRFEFKGAVATSGREGWVDHRPYYFKIEWRAGTATLRVWSNTTREAGGGLKVTLSVNYGGTYNPTNHTVTLGSLFSDTLRDVRYSRFYVGSNARPVSLEGGV